MKKGDLEKAQVIFDLITRKWWFLLVFTLIGTITPPIVTKGYDPSKTGEIILHILENALIKYCSPLYPVFKIIPVILIFALILLGNSVSRFFLFMLVLIIFSPHSFKVPR